MFFTVFAFFALIGIVATRQLLLERLNRSLNAYLEFQKAQPNFIRLIAHQTIAVTNERKRLGPMVDEYYRQVPQHLQIKVCPELHGDLYSAIVILGIEKQTLQGMLEASGGIFEPLLRSRSAWRIRRRARQAIKLAEEELAVAPRLDKPVAPATRSETGGGNRGSYLL